MTAANPCPLTLVRVLHRKDKHANLPTEDLCEFVAEDEQAPKAILPLAELPGEVATYTWPCFATNERFEIIALSVTMSRPAETVAGVTVTATRYETSDATTRGYSARPRKGSDERSRSRFTAGTAGDRRR